MAFIFLDSGMLIWIFSVTLNRDIHAKSTEITIATDRFSSQKLPDVLVSDLANSGNAAKTRSLEKSWLIREECWADMGNNVEILRPIIVTSWRLRDSDFGLKADFSKKFQEKIIPKWPIQRQLLMLLSQKKITH